MSYHGHKEAWHIEDVFQPSGSRPEMLWREKARARCQLPTGQDSSQKSVVVSRRLRTKDVLCGERQVRKAVSDGYLERVAADLGVQWGQPMVKAELEGLG